MRRTKAIQPPWKICKQSFGIAALVLAAMAVSPRAWAHAPGIVLSGDGTARIDGVIGPGEWASAGCVDFPVNLPEGGTTPGTVCVMNDAVNLYLAIRFARTVVDPGNSASVEFDNDHSEGSTVNGDDIILLNPDKSVGFRDEVRTNAPPCPPGALCGFSDTDLGGTNDGAGAFHNDGTHTVYEFSHPLNSADNAHDFSLTPGSVVGFSLFIRMIDAASRLADTYFPTVCIACHNLFGDIVIVPSTKTPLPTPPTAAVALNFPGAVFHQGQTVTYQATLTPGSAPTQVDVYIWALLPDEATFLSLVQGPSGGIATALGASPIPFQVNVVLTQSVVVPSSHTFEGFEPIGTYFVFAALVIPGSSPLLRENHLAFAVQSFQFSSDVILSVSVSGSGSVTSSPGGINCGRTCVSTFAAGTTVTLTAQGQGSTFAGWSGDCASAGTHATCTLGMTTNKHVGASFSTAGSGGPGGYCSPYMLFCGIKFNFTFPPIRLF